MTARTAKIYWVKGKDGNDALVFDAGYKAGTAYVYTFQEAMLIPDAQKTEKNIQSWIEENFGSLKGIWRIEQSFDPWQ
jgi:hypothetical protein